MNVMNITACPTSPEVLRDRGIKLKCSVGKEYHCMMNEKKRHVELCISRSWIQPDHCPEYNTAANRIDVSACDSSDGVCPPVIYWSNNSFLYSGCFPEQGTTNTSNPEDSNDILVISVVVSLLSILVICIVCAVLFVRCRRKRRGSKREEESPLSTGENTLFSLEEEIKKGRETIDEHRADNTYIPTHAAKRGKSILDKKKILVIQGITGSGKTKTALHIASEWMREDESSRKCVYPKSLDDLQNVTFQDNTCVILDGCFTRWVLDSSSTYVSTFCLRLHEQIKENNLIYLIITVHKYIHSTHRSMLQKYDLFSNEHHLTLEYEDYEEKKRILTSHVKRTEGNTRHILSEKKLKFLSKRNENVGFPSLCWMYTNIPECEKIGGAFFLGYALQKIIVDMKNPLRCCLFYAMLKNEVGEFDTSKIDDECFNILKKEYSCDKMTDEQLLKCFEKDNPFFTSRRNNVFSFSQTAIYEACLKKWFANKNERRLFFRLCNLEQVKENIRDQTYKVESGTCILVLETKEFSLFAAKFATIMGDQKELKYHPLLQNQSFNRIVNEECLENKSQPAVQKKIYDALTESESRLLLPKQQEDQPNQKQEDQPNQKQEDQPNQNQEDQPNQNQEDQPNQNQEDQSEQQQQQTEQESEQQQKQQKQSLTQVESMEIDCRSATSNEKLLKEDDRQQNVTATAAHEEKEISPKRKNYSSRRGSRKKILKLQQK